MSNTPVHSWGIIRVAGPEAAKFLHSQLSNSIEHQPDQELRLACFCNAKGRIMGSFFVWQENDNVYLLCKKDLVHPLVKRLNLFKLRAKCEINDHTRFYKISCQPTPGQAGMQVSHSSDDTHLTIGLSSSPTQTITLRVARNVNDTEPKLVPQDTVAETAGDDLFDTHLQQMGIAWISLETQEKFIPQDLNLDLVGAIHFEKGCYPGQEVVARSHYIGKVKRRAFFVSLPQDETVRPGQDVWLKGKTNEPIGRVVTCSTYQKQHHMLIVLPLAEGLNTDSQFCLHPPELDENWFSVSAPSYDLTQKGNQFQ